METRLVAGQVSSVIPELGEASLDVLDERHRGIQVGAVSRGIRGAPSCAIETCGEKSRVVGHWFLAGAPAAPGGPRVRTVAPSGASGHPPIDVIGMNRSGQRERDPNGAMVR